MNYFNLSGLKKTNIYKIEMEEIKAKGRNRIQVEKR